MQTTEQEQDLQVHPIAIFDGKFHTRDFETGHMAIQDLFAFIAGKGHEVRRKKDGQAFNLNVYAEDSERHESNIIETGGIVLDIDKLEPSDLDEVLEKAKQYKSICYTTHTHSPDAPRLRLVFPLAAAILPTDYKEYAQRVAHHLGIDCDDCSFVVNQIYYLPAHPPKANGDHFIHPNADQDFLDVSALPSAPPKRVKGKGSKSDRDEKQLNLFKLADLIIENHFDGHIRAVGDEIFEYVNGYWQAPEPNVFAKRLSELEEVDGVLTSAAQLDGLVRALKVRAAIAGFPEATAMTVNVLNGVLDLNTGQLGTHAPEHFHRNQLEVAYDPNSGCPRWIQHLDEVFDRDTDREAKIKFLQEWFGYMLTPSAAYQKMLWMVGSGANGKNVVLDVMANMLGEANCTSMTLNEISTEFLRCGLHGKLANFSSEMEVGRRLNDGFVKAVVSGDSITANRKGLSPIIFRPYARLVSAMNDLPPLKDISHGFFRRLIVLQFNRTFAPAEMDHTLAQKLKAETAGIVSWAVEGLHRLQNEKRFTSVASSDALCRQYQFESDPVAMFIAASLTRSEKSKVLKKEVYDKYKEFCATDGYNPLSNAQFGKAMKERGIMPKESGGKGYYCVVFGTGSTTDEKSSNSATESTATSALRTSLAEFIGSEEEEEDEEAVAQ